MPVWKCICAVVIYVCFFLWCAFAMAFAAVVCKYACQNITADSVLSRMGIVAIAATCYLIAAFCATVIFRPNKWDFSIAFLLCLGIATYATYTMLVVLIASSLILGAFSATRVLPLASNTYNKWQTRLSGMSWPCRIAGKVIHGVLFLAGIVITATPVLGLRVVMEKTTALEYTGSQAPSISLVTYEGQPWELSDQRGKVVVLDYWATWCAPCRSALPEMRKLRDEFINREVVLVGVSVDEDRDAHHQFCLDNQIDWLQVYTPAGLAEMDNGEELPVIAVPSVWIIDANGVIVGANLRGQRVREVLETTIHRREAFGSHITQADSDAAVIDAAVQEAGHAGPG